MAQPISPYLLMGQKQPVDENDPLAFLLANQSAAQQPAMSMERPGVLPSNVQSSEPSQQDMSAAAAGGVTAPPPEAAPQEMSLEDQLRAAYGASAKSWEDQIKDAEQRLLQAQKSSGNINLMPIARLVDQWTGSQLAAGYTPPQPKDKTVQALQDAVLKARTGLTENQLKALTSQLSLQQRAEEAQANREERALRREQIKGAGEERKNLADIKLQMEAEDKYDKRFGEGIEGLTEVVDAARMAKDIIAESGGIPTPNDKERYALYKRQVSRIITGYNRDVAKLGALAGADKELLEKAASNDAGVLESYFKRVIGSEGQVKVLDDLLAAADKKMAQHGELVKDRFAGFGEKIFEKQKKFYEEARGGKALSTQKSYDEMSEEEIQKAWNEKIGGNK